MAWGIEQIPHLNFILFIAELPYILPSAALTKNGTRILHSGHINAVSNFTWAFRTEKSCTHLGPSWSTFHAEVHIFRSYGRTDKLVFGKNIRSRPWHFGRFPPFLGTEILLNKVDITLNLESVDLKRLDVTLFSNVHSLARVYFKLLSAFPSWPHMLQLLLHYIMTTLPIQRKAQRGLLLVAMYDYMSGIESSENNCNVVVRQWTWQKLKNTTHLIIGRRLCHLQVITEEKARYHPGTLPIMGPEGLELTTSSQQPFDQLHSLGR